MTFTSCLFTKLTKGDTLREGWRRGKLSLTQTVTGRRTEARGTINIADIQRDTTECRRRRNERRNGRGRKKAYSRWLMGEGEYSRFRLSEREREGERASGRANKGRKHDCLREPRAGQEQH